VRKEQPEKPKIKRPEEKPYRKRSESIKRAIK
jgi:hypothetical protein